MVPDRTVYSSLRTAHLLVKFSCLLLLIHAFCVQRAWFLIGLYSGFLCAKSMVPDRTVHSSLHTGQVAYCSYTGQILLSGTINSGFLCAKSKAPDLIVHSSLHTAHILVKFCCLLLLIQTFCVQRARLLTGLSIHSCILFIYWSYFVACYY